ncbi:DUF721 domain-containing protein [Candidatus Poribacteria bacterium]|nr:DUF721 domain-containing protein [Candidatus Poribacteria bacterium]
MGKLSNATHRMNDIIENLCHEYGFEHKILEQKVLAAWSHAVGEPIARNTRPISLINGKLSVYTSHTLWMTELLFLKQHVIQEINTVVGQRAVKELHFSVRPKDSPSRPKIQRYQRSHRLIQLEGVELAPEVLAQIEGTVAAVEDPELKASLKRLFIMQSKRAALECKT